MNLGLKGKFALITGGTHGIGKAIAIALAKEGCNVAVTSRSKDKVAQALKEIKKTKVEALGLSGDVQKSKDIKKVFNSVIKKWGRIDILVNNVGGGGRWGSEDVLKTKEQVWRQVYEKNAFAAVQFTMLALPFMKKQKWGRVITITSTYGLEAGGRPWLNMAKSAQIALMKNLAIKPDLVRCNITFNSVAPGGIMISGTGWENERKGNPKAFDEMVDKKFPLGRLGKPEEVANVVAFVASIKANLVNGASILVDGGESRVF